LHDQCRVDYSILCRQIYALSDRRSQQFKNGAQFGAWLGLTPRQNSSGGKVRLAVSVPATHLFFLL